MKYKIQFPEVLLTILLLLGSGLLFVLSVQTKNTGGAIGYLFLGVFVFTGALVVATDALRRN